MTIDVVFRNEKGDELTWEEMDANLANLKVAIEAKKDNFAILPVAQGGTGVATIDEAKQVLGVEELELLIYDQLPEIAAAADEAQAAKTAAESARDAALLSRGVFATTAKALSKGVVGVASLVGGSGGTNGTFDLVFSGGAGSGAAGRFVVAGGVVVSVTITATGDSYTSAPTISFSASSGLTGASATAVIAANADIGEYFSVPVIDSNDSLILYRVDAGPVATEVVRYPSTSLTTSLAGILPLFTENPSNNLYSPDLAAALPVGAKAPANYNNGGTWGTSLSYYGTSGIISGLTIGNTYTVNILGGPSSVALSRAQGGFFWTSGNTFSSQVAHNGTTMNFSSDNRSVTFTAVTEKVSFNFVRSPSSDPMADVFAAVLSALMVNAGSTPMAFEPVIPTYPFLPGGKFFPTFSETDDVRVFVDGAGFFYARTKWDSTYDKVQRYRFGTAADTTGNALWDHWGERLIPIYTGSESMKTAFDASILIVRGAVDEGPPMNINGMWLAGGHGPLCRKVQVTGHGFVAADIGSKWSDGIRNRVLAQILDANYVRFIEEPGGTAAAWTLGSRAVSGTTLNWVSGGVATGSKTVASDVIDQAWPFIRSRSGSVTLDGVDISAAGTYSGKLLRFSEQYDIPNLYRAVSYLIANTGSGTNSLTNASIGGQIDFSMSHTLDWTGITRTVWTPVDVEGYVPGQYSGSQTLRPETPSGGTLKAYVPRSKPFSGFDFETGQDITSWVAAQYFSKSAAWIDPADPPNKIVFVAADNAAVPKWGNFYALDDIAGQGKTASRATLNNALLLSSIKKAYLIAGDSTSPSGAGQVHETVSYVGGFNPSSDAALNWCVTHPKGNGYAVSAMSPGVLTAHWVPVDGRLIGRTVTLSRGDSIATLLSSVVGDRGVLVSWSAPGEVVLNIGND